jgi:pilus assembly protein CpaF
MRDLMEAILHHRPDRIVVGEVRGAEAISLLEALNTGHSGILSTIHANSAAQTPGRLTTCVLKAGGEMPYRAIRSSIAESIDVIVHIKREKGSPRQISEVVEMDRYDAVQDTYTFKSVHVASDALLNPQIP